MTHRPTTAVLGVVTEWEHRNDKRKYQIWNCAKLPFMALMRYKRHKASTEVERIGKNEEWNGVA